MKLKMIKNMFTYLDNKNILWKIVNDELIGKRSVYTKELKADWLEDVKKEDVKDWWCGESADYKEIFKIK